MEYRRYYSDSMQVVLKVVKSSEGLVIEFAIFFTVRGFEFSLKYSIER